MDDFGPYCGKKGNFGDMATVSGLSAVSFFRNIFMLVLMDAFRVQTRDLRRFGQVAYLDKSGPFCLLGPQQRRSVSRTRPLQRPLARSGSLANAAGRARAPRGPEPRLLSGQDCPGSRSFP